MMKHAILALGAASLALLSSPAALVKAGSVLPAPVAPSPPTVTRCAQVETGSVDGFVSNQGAQPYRLRGEVRFVFTSGAAASRPPRMVQGDVELPPGKPVRVARARLDFPLKPGEECRLEIDPAALRKD
jgi:hypothetical protein